jgi:hypothetical protein
MGTGRIKGSHLLSTVKALRANRERAHPLLRPELRKYLEMRILPSTWYPVDEQVGLLHVLVQLLPASKDPWAFLGRATALADLTGVYKSYLAPGDPGRTLISMGAMWGSTHDSGECSTTLEGACAATILLRNFPLRSRNFCRSTTWYLTAAIELAGGRSQRVVHTRCVADGGEDCCWTATWTVEQS